MRQVRLIGALFALGQLALAHGQTFNRRYDTFDQQQIQVAWAIDKNGSDGDAVTITSYYVDTPYVYITCVMTRLNADGEVLSVNRMLGGMSSAYSGFVDCAQPTHDGGLVIGGTVWPPSDIPFAALIRYGAGGDSLWLQQYGDSLHSWLGRKALEAKNHDLLLVGETAAVGHTDGFVIRTDSAGNELWRRTYGGPQNHDYIVGIDTTDTDGFFLGGEYGSTASNYDYWVQRINRDGDTLWSRRWGSQYDEPNAQLSTLANGNPVLGGCWGFAPEFALTQAYLAELDKDDGHILWEHRYGPIVDLATMWTPKEVAPGRGCITPGFIYPENSNFLQGVLLRTNADGDSTWMRNYFYYDSLMTDGMGELKDVVPTPDGGFMACGYTFGAYTGPYPANYSQDAWIVKVDSMGCLVPGCDDIPLITAQVTNLSGALTLFPNPVPSDQWLQIRIDLPSSFHPAGPLVLSITGPDGKLIKQQLVASSSDLEQISLAGIDAGTYALHLSDAHTWIAGKKFVVY